MAVLAQKNAFSNAIANGATASRPNIGNIQSSYSTNDIPTLKGSSSSSTASTTLASPTANSSSVFQKPNTGLSRGPTNVMNKRLSRDLPSPETRQEDVSIASQQLQSELQPSATPFGPGITAGSPIEPNLVTSPSLPNFNNLGGYYGYGMSLMNMGINPMQMGNTSYNNMMQYYQSQNQYGSLLPYNTAGRGQDSQARVIQQRRMQNVEGKLNALLRIDL